MKTSEEPLADCSASWDTKIIDIHPGIIPTRTHYGGAACRDLPAALAARGQRTRG